MKTSWATTSLRTLEHACSIEKYSSQGYQIHTEIWHLISTHDCRTNLSQYRTSSIIGDRHSLRGDWEPHEGCSWASKRIPYYNVELHVSLCVDQKYNTNSNSWEVLRWTSKWCLCYVPFKYYHCYKRFVQITQNHSQIEIFVTRVKPIKHDSTISRLWVPNPWTTYQLCWQTSITNARKKGLWTSDYSLKDWGTQLGVFPNSTLHITVLQL